jgi:hypothetical protein
MIELATKTITAEIRIGSHKAVMGTIVPPGKRRWAPEVPSRTPRAYAWLTEIVKPEAILAPQRKEEYSGCDPEAPSPMDT